VIRNYFHRWEQELAAVSQDDRKVRPFEWGLDWIEHPHASDLEASPKEIEIVSKWVDRVMQDTDAFFTPEPTRYTFTKAPDTIRAAGEAGVLTFTSGLTTPHPENNTVVCRYFLPDPIRKPKPGAKRRAVVVLAQWNSDPDGHIGLCKILQKLGIASLRISLPYHDARMPPELRRADYIVSSNIVRTLQVCRQAVRDVRLALWWLRDQGYDTLGLLGTSLGSCLSYLTTAHEPLVGTQALNHVSPFFGDVVWQGLSTEHVRAARSRRARRHRSAARSMAPDQPLVVPRSPSRQEDVDGLREVRPHVPCRSVAEVDQRAHAPRLCPRSPRAALRSLLDRRVAVQISRRLVSREILVHEPVETGLEKSHQPHQRVVDRSGQRLDEGRDFAGVDRLGDGDRIGENQPHRGARDHRRK
jgi:hypothetical protein